VTQPRLRAGQGRFVGHRWWPGSFSDGPMERGQCSSTELWDLLWLGMAGCFSPWSFQSKKKKFSRSIWFLTPTSWGGFKEGSLDDYGGKKPMVGLEPTAVALRMRCSTN